MKSPFGSRTRKYSPREGNLRTLIVGAGEAGRTLAQALRSAPDYGLSPIGFLDDNDRQRTIVGLPLLGTLDDLARAARSNRAEAVVIAVPSLPSEKVQALVQGAAAVGLRLHYLPSFLSAVERDARVSDLRSIKLDHLLGRDEVHVVSARARSVVEGRRVLVTGAGGSIGTELCRQVKAFAPAALYVLDHDESNLHTLQLELCGEGLLDSDEVIVADIRDRARILQVFEDTRPDIVFHAAAHKHLPLLERHPCEGVKSNVLGTHNLVDAAMETDVDLFILISTDKAADPSSVLGATKRLAEMLLQTNGVGPTRFASVRFGNVLGSRGSFLHVVMDQLKKQEPVTITHPDVSRFFMTIEEAVGLVMEAAQMAEFGETFVLDMGEPVRIVDLVRKIAAEAHMPDDRVTLRFSGLRPGEKLNEALFSQLEERLPTAHTRIWATLPAPVQDEFGVLLENLYQAAERNSPSEVRACLRALLPDYTPSTSGQGREVLASVYPDGF